MSDRSHRGRSKTSPPWHPCFFRAFPIAAVRLAKPAESQRTGPESDASGNPLRRLVLPEGFVVEHRFLNRYAANLDFSQVRRADSRGFGQKHHVVGVLEGLIGGVALIDR